MVQNFALAAVLVMFAAVPTLAGAEKGADHKGGTTTTPATEASATTSTGGDAGKGEAKAGSADDKTVAAEAPKTDGTPAKN